MNICGPDEKYVSCTKHKSDLHSSLVAQIVQCVLKKSFIIGSWGEYNASIGACIPLYKFHSHYCIHHLHSKHNILIAAPESDIIYLSCDEGFYKQIL
jgi:hypothetical protein